MRLDVAPVSNRKSPSWLSFASARTSIWPETVQYSEPPVSRSPESRVSLPFLKSSVMR